MFIERATAERFLLAPAERNVNAFPSPLLETSRSAGAQGLGSHTWIYKHSAPLEPVPAKLTNLAKNVIAAHKPGAEEGKKDQGESGYAHPGRHASAPTGSGTVKNQQQVEQPRQRRKDLFWIIVP